MTSSVDDADLSLEPALEQLRDSLGPRGLLDDASAVHAGERLAWAMTRRSAPAVSVSRVPVAPAWLEPWAACLPLARSGPARVVRMATVVRTETGLVCIDPVVPTAWLRTPLGERMRSLHERDTSETFPMTLHQAIGRAEDFTEVIFTSLAMQSLRELLGTTHGDGLEPVLPRLFPNARIVVGRDALARPRTEADRATDVRGGLARLGTEDLVEIAEPTLLPSGLVVVPTGGHVPEHLTVAFVQRRERARVAIVTSQLTTRDAFSPYESSLPGLREHARLRDTELALRGDAHDSLAHRRALLFERALTDRDPEDPRFHLAYPSLALA